MGLIITAKKAWKWLKLCTIVILYVSDILIFGTGLLSFFTTLILLQFILEESKKMEGRYRCKAICICIPPLCFILIVGWLYLNNILAESRSKVIINACYQYLKDNGRLPFSLEQLVPKYLTQIPNAKYIDMQKKYYYFSNQENNRYLLSWIVYPPFARKYYTFNKQNNRYHTACNPLVLERVL